MNSIFYLHCHQQTHNGSVVILVGHDGVQYPPICFPKGSHLMQFLNCLETGLAPNAGLDPPLLTQDGCIDKGLFNNVKSKPKPCDLNNNSESKPTSETEDFEPKDFVFRITNKRLEGKV
jgi:hypothetical protein